MAGLSVQLLEARAPCIIPSIPPMPPGGIAGPSCFFGFSATVASVVISTPAQRGSDQGAIASPVRPRKSRRGASASIRASSALNRSWNDEGTSDFPGLCCKDCPEW